MCQLLKSLLFNSSQLSSVQTSTSYIQTFKNIPEWIHGDQHLRLNNPSELRHQHLLGDLEFHCASDLNVSKWEEPPPPPPHANSAHPRRGSKQTTGTWRNRLLNESHFIGLVPAAHTLSGIVMSWSELGCSIITAIHHSHYSIQPHQIVMWGQAPVSRRRTPVWPVGAVFLNFEEMKTQYISILVRNKYIYVIIMRHCNRKCIKLRTKSL